jgi:hypothetical protein
LWQAADIAIPALGLPDVIMRYVVAGAILGFPFVVILSWIYDLRIDNTSPVNRRTFRSLSLVVLAVLIITAGAILVRDGGSDASERAAGLPFEMGVEEFFSGNLQQAEAIFAGIAADGSDSDGNRRDALRYLVRSYSLNGQRENAMEALRSLLALEPPIALMSPAVETENVMALYYDARRERMGVAIESDRTPIEAVEVIAFVDRTVHSDQQTESPAATVPDSLGLGDGIASFVAVELAQRAHGMMVIDRSDVGGHHGLGVYRYLESPDADRIVRPTHLVFGSIAGQEGSQMLLSAWVFEVASGRLTHFSQALGPWHDAWEVVLRLTDDLTAKLSQDF